MSASKEVETRGQAMVEFALIIGVLLMIIFVVIEAGHLLQANLTVQNAARAAGRYAITGQFETDCQIETPPCEDPRVASIQSVAEEALSGLSLNPDAGFEEAGYYLIEVFGTNAAGELVENSAGMPGRPIIVRVSFRAPVWTPLLRPIAETVMVTGQTVMNNEKVVQANTAGDAEAPAPPAPPPIEPTPPPPPDLVLSKSAPSSVVEGASLQYMLSLTNNGQQAATNVVLNDPVADGLSLESVSPSADCSPSVSCSWSSLAVGESKSLVIQVTVDEGTAGTTITNTASVTLDQNDANVADNTAQAVTNIVADTTETDLEVTKTGPESAPVSTAEEEFTVDYEITVRNKGPNEAVGVVVTDTLPVGLAFRSNGSSGECQEGPPVTCNLGALANGESRTLTIRARTPFSEGSPTNTAIISAEDLEDFDDSNDSSSHVTNFVFIADLEITKSASSSTVNAGEVLIYTIDVWNSAGSPHAATGVNISDALPNFVTLESATYDAPDSDGDCTVSGNVVTCPIGTLEPGGDHGFATIVITPQRPGTLINSAGVAGEQNDPDTFNNATAVTMVDALSDLSILKSVEPDQIFAGDLITYTLTVQNDGPSRATGVTVVDNLPEEVVFQNVQSNYGSCQWSSVLRRVTCSLGTVPADAVATIRIMVIPHIPEDAPDEWAFDNEASVTGDEPDPADNNNSAVTTTVYPGDPYIVLQPSCGSAEAPVTIEGYRWSGNRTVAISWIDEAGATAKSVTIASNAINNQTGRFTHADAAPEGAIKETFRVRAQQEAQGNTEAAEDIKVFNVPCPNPDLEVISLVGDLGQVEQYEPVTYTVTITNSGNEVANSSFFVSLYAFEEPVSSTTTHLTATNRLDVASVSSLGVGASRELTLYALDGFPATGTYYVYAAVDSDPGPAGRINEMYETNNLAEDIIEVVEGSGEAPTDPPQGDQQLSGETYIFIDDDEETFGLQPLVRVSVYDAPGGVWLGTTYSDLINAEYRFTSLPEAEEYYVEASITADGVLYSFAGTVSPPLHTLILYPE